MLKIRHYILSLIVFLIICYLSFFKPPSIESIPTIPHLDKLVHFLMYAGFSSIIWLDYWRRNRAISKWSSGWYIGCCLPILISGIIELLQEYCTEHRGGEWLDLLANSLGALVASSLIYLFFKIKVNR